MTAKLYTPFLLLILFTACKKSDSPERYPAVPINPSLLLNKQWEISNVYEHEQKPAGSFVINLLTLNPYDEDDYFVFNSDLTYTFNAGALKAPGTTDDILDSGTWRVVLTSAVWDSYIELKSSLSQPLANSHVISPARIVLLSENNLAFASLDSVRNVSIATNFQVRK